MCVLSKPVHHGTVLRDNDFEPGKDLHLARNFENSGRGGGGGGAGLTVRSIFRNSNRKLRAVLCRPPRSHFCHKRLRGRPWLFTINKMFPENPIGK